MATFRIVVTTGRRFYNDTRSNAWIQIFDWHGNESPKIQLGEQGHEFVYGRPDSFTINVDGEFEPVRAIEITKDNSGRQPAWYLDNIVLINENTETRNAFPFGQWFSGRNGLVHRKDPHGTVYWCARDMSDSPIFNHHFLTVMFHSHEAAISLCAPFGYSPESEEVDEKTYYFLTLGAFAPGHGFGQPMHCIFNQTDDVLAVREYLDPRGHTSLLLPDFDYEGHHIWPLCGQSERQFIEAVIRAAENFNQHESRPTFEGPGRNCATFVNSLVASLGYDEDMREALGDLRGFDVGEDELIDASYFSPPTS